MSNIAIAPVRVQLLTIRQTAEALKLSERSIQNLISSGQLRSVKVGRSRRIPTDVVSAFASAGVEQIGA